MPAGAVASPQSNGQLASFRSKAARHRKSKVYTITYNAGATQTIGLNNVGYLDELDVTISVSAVVPSGGIAYTDGDKWISNFIPRLVLRSPQGAVIWNTNSRDEFDWNYVLDYAIKPASDPSYSNFTGVTQTGGTQAAATYTIYIRLRLPVAINTDSNFDTYMLMRQVANNQFQLDVTMAGLTGDLGNTTAFTSITGSIYIGEVFYEAVATGAKVRPPDFTWYVRKRFVQTSSFVNGLNDVAYPTGPIILQALFRLVNNSVADGTITNLTTLQVLANTGNEVDNRTGQDLAGDAVNLYGQALRAGVYIEDFLNDVGALNQTKGRDFINSNQASQFDFYLTYGGTPSGTSTIQQSYREVVKLTS